MKNIANINPKVMRWARETAKIDKELASLKVHISVDKIDEWESGVSQPTINQAQILAKAYKRPFALFFLPDIPRDFQPLQDYRIKGSKELSTASLFIIREIQQKQAWIKELKEDNDEEKLLFVGKYSKNDLPEIVAKDIITTLGIDPLHYENDTPILDWIRKAENYGIFISRTSFIHSRLTLDSDEIQGFAIADPFAPFIFVNSDDWKAPQLFTLVHELAHIWISESGISNEVDLNITNKDKYHPVELFCNKVAACALIPNTFLENIDAVVFKHSDEIFKISKKLGVSAFSFLVRSLQLNLISVDTYKSLKEEATIEFGKYIKREEEKYAKMKAKNSKGAPIYFQLQINRNSRLFTHTVLDAYHGGYIEPTLASNLLNIKVNKFPKLEAQLYK